MYNEYTLGYIPLQENTDTSHLSVSELQSREAAFQEWLHAVESCLHGILVCNRDLRTGNLLYFNGFRFSSFLEIQSIIFKTLVALPDHYVVAANVALCN